MTLVGLTMHPGPRMRAPFLCAARSLSYCMSRSRPARESADLARIRGDLEALAAGWKRSGGGEEGGITPRTDRQRAHCPPFLLQTMLTPVGKVRGGSYVQTESPVDFVPLSGGLPPRVGWRRAGEPGLGPDAHRVPGP